MAIRQLLLLIIAVLIATAVWAKESPKLNPQTFIERSDQLYFLPHLHGVTDLAVDVVMDQFAKDPVIGKAQITICYAGGDRRGVVIANIPPQQEKFRTALLAMVDPLGEYVVPKSSIETFADMQIRAYKVYRQISGLPGTTFYELTGTPTDEKSPLQEYRVLVDERGLAYQVETKAKDGNGVTARIENVRIGDHWFIGKISTRILSKSGPHWEIATVTYGDANGYTLPLAITIQHRNSFNQPIKELPDLAYRFDNYRINTGAAAALLPEPATPAPTE